MRLLMTADAVGGVWSYTLELARALAAHGVGTTVATMGPQPTDDQIADAADIPEFELEIGAFRLEWMPDAWSDVDSAGDWLLGIESRVRPSLVHLNGYAHAFLPWRSPVIIVGHSCVASWADAVGDSIDPAWLAEYRDRVGCGIRTADWVVAPTAAMLDALQNHYGPIARTAIIANGRDARGFRQGPKQPFVFTAGRLWDRAKNVGAMRMAAKRLSWPVVIAGEPKLTQAEIADRLARASIFALPARYEPFGLLPLEAALSGCALVLGDIRSLREVWGDTAVYVPPDDCDALVDAIETLIRDGELRAAYADVARRRAALFTPSRMAARYIEVYSVVTGALRCVS